jgi:phenylacetate-CoA ligase
MLPFDRFPLLTDSGYQTLRALEEHPHAPRYTHPGYHRLTPAGLEHARAFAQDLESAPSWTPNTPPTWVSSFIADCFRNVPVYRRGGQPPASFFDLPTTSRADLNREPWAFVPDGQSLDDLVIYNTSGVTGHPLSILTHPDVLALYIPLWQRALTLAGINAQFASTRLGVAYVGYQQQTYTYAALSPLLNDAGLVKINLHPSQWRSPDDPAKFLNDLNPQIYTGTPLAFAQLAQLPLTVQPAALISTSMTLTPGLRAQLESHFNCPILDLYSTNETGPIGFSLAGNNYELLQPRLYLEILDSDDQPCPPGQRGEVTVTGGFNPFLPLLRYRTGDYAALSFQGSLPHVVDLEGRPPVLFRATDGRPLNNIDISIALRPYPLAQFQLHQFADGALRLGRQPSSVPDDTLRTTLLNLFGRSQTLTIEDLPSLEKARQYTSEID